MGNGLARTCRHSSTLHVALVASLWASWCPPLSAQESASSQWSVRTVDHVSGEPLSGVALSLPDLRINALTNRSGVATFPTTTLDSVRVMATRIGYHSLDAVVAIPSEGSMATLVLRRSPVTLAALTVRSERAAASSLELARQIFEREVVVGAIGVTQAEVKAVPAIAEADVFRSLESFSGVTSTNDFGSEIFLRGGDFDQLAVFLDGAPVFGPHHMFGMFGLFNPDAIGSVEFFKGSIPARYGGSLSGVMSAQHRTRSGPGLGVSGGLSMLGLRVAARGPVPWSDGSWLIAGRRATTDVTGIAMPYSFHDLNLGTWSYLGEEHRLGWSLLASQDHFALELDHLGESLDSEWGNLVSSLTWSWVPNNRTNSDLTVYFSNYDATVSVGNEGSRPYTRNRIGARGVRGQLAIRGERIGVRVGGRAEAGPVSLLASGPGAYIESQVSDSYRHGSLFAEVERWIGRLRLAPGFRIGAEGTGSRSFLEPRLSGRLHIGAVALSASLDRAYQFLSAVRDDRYIVPGPPMWSLCTAGLPASVADGISLAVDARPGETWTGSAGFWVRQFADNPRWRPDSARDLSALEFHGGHALGWDVSIQRHKGLLRGWASYQWAKVAFRDQEGGEYMPHWDRRHEVDVTLQLGEVSGWSASLRTRIASGTPFWIPAGYYHGLTYDPTIYTLGLGSSSNLPRGLGYSGESFTILSGTQGRLPYYARLDVSIRHSFRWRTWNIEPFLSVPNILGRRNVYLYWSTPSIQGNPQRVTLTPYGQIPTFPFIGIDFRF